MTPHKHAKFIKSWADGSEIEILISNNAGKDGWEIVKNPFWHEFEVYRVKPERKPNVVTWHEIHEKSVGKGMTFKTSCETFTVIRIEIDHNDPANPVLVSATLEEL